MTSTDSPRIYVACLAAYNNGVLHGAWIDADQDADDIHAEIQKMLSASPIPNAEEWAIHDYDNFHGIKIGEYDDIAKVAELAELLSEHGEAYAAYVSHVGEEYATAEGFEGSYQGEYDSPEDFAEETCSDIYDLNKIPDVLRYHIDWEGVARDLRLGGDYAFVDSDSGSGRTYVFRSC